MECKSIWKMSCYIEIIRKQLLSYHKLFLSIDLLPFSMIALLYFLSFSLFFTLKWQSCLQYGRLARWRKWRACDVAEAKEELENELWRKWSNGRVGEWAVTKVKRRKDWRLSCDVGEVTERFENELCLSSCVPRFVSAISAAEIRRVFNNLF